VFFFYFFSSEDADNFNSCSFQVLLTALKLFKHNKLSQNITLHCKFTSEVHNLSWAKDRSVLFLVHSVAKDETMSWTFESRV